LRPEFWQHKLQFFLRAKPPAVTSTSRAPTPPDGTCLVAAHSDALAYLRGGGASTTLNCGYGRGFSVLDVIETVKRVSGVDFKVEFAARRAGDPPHVVAACDRIR